MKNATCHPERRAHANGLCNSCHTVLWNRENREYVRDRRRKLKVKLLAEIGGQCVDCGFRSHPAALDFDHVDPTTKRFNVGMSLQKPWLELLEEVRKCVVRCANCHRIRTHPHTWEEVAQGLRRAPIAALVLTHCEHCGANLTHEEGRTRRYCDARCGNAHRQKLYRERRRA